VKVGLLTLDIQVVPMRNITDTLMPRNTATEGYCGERRGISLALIDDVKWCINFIRKKPNDWCWVPGFRGVSLFCQRNDAFIYGVGYNPDHVASEQSICNDVALAADWILDNCVVDFSEFSGPHPHQEFRVGGKSCRSLLIRLLLKWN
jgi:hypothetical protein